MHLINPYPIKNTEKTNGSVILPGSKSITNRAIIIAALAKGKSLLKGALDSIDTKMMLQAWKNLGIQMEHTKQGIQIKGSGGVLKLINKPLYVENAGTVSRFMTAALNLGTGRYTLLGNQRMSKRPIKDLLDALRQIGCDILDIEGTGCFPLEIEAKGIQGGHVEIQGEKSSQYISAIMLSAPYAIKDTYIHIKGKLVSKTYVNMTMQMMESFGVNLFWDDERCIKIPSGQCYQSREYNIEGDASSASYFFGLAAITKGKIKIQGIARDSIQGDIGLVTILEKMGCSVEEQDSDLVIQGRKLKGITVDMNTMSDVAPTLAVVAMFAEGTTKIKNVWNMRIKECDRISALNREMTKLGAKVIEKQEGLEILGQQNYSGASLDTYDDHRMAMSLSLAGILIPNIFINDPNCVRKTFPNYFEMFEKITKVSSE